MHQNFAPTLGLCILPFARSRRFVRIAPERGHFSINHFCHFWNFHYNGKNWRLTTLWDLFIDLKFYMFLKKIIQSQIEPKPKNENDFSDQIENAKQFDCQAFDFENTLENLSV